MELLIHYFQVHYQILLQQNQFYFSILIACTIISQSLFVAPITLVGFTALSVEIKTNLSLYIYLHIQQHLMFPNTLFLIASRGLSSIKGTCLCAAA